jgi:hypothetical protein
MPHSEEISARLMRPERWFGGLIAVLVCSANANQALTNAPTVLNFDTNNVGPFGQISRSGTDIIIGVSGFYAFSFQPQLLQNTANQLTTFWARKNGVDVPSSGFRFRSTGNNDTLVQPWSVTASLVSGDIIRFVAQTSVALGSTLEATVAGGGIPAIPALRLDVRGYGPVA